MQKRFGRPLLAALAALCCSSLVSQAEEVTLTFATANPPNAHLTVGFMKPWAEHINEVGKGVVKIDLRDGMALATPYNSYDRVMSDVIQIGWAIQAAVAGKLVRSDVISMPFLTGNGEEGSVAFWRTYEQGGFDPEYDDLQPLVFCQFAQTGLQLVKTPKSLDDLNGFKLVVASKISADEIRRLGGTPLSIPLPDSYEALQRGTGDGIMIGWTAFQPFKLHEVTTYHVDNNIGSAAGMIFMSKKKFQSLPAPVQKILTDNSGETPSREFGKFWDRIAAETRQRVAAMPGHTYVEFTPEQTAKWKARLDPITEEWAKNTPGGEKALAIYRKNITEVKAGK
jgi:TRAP-type C4-dicarboxylate transport system substrate-binding protein